MITRTALLYLSKRHNLKNYFSRFDAFNRIKRRFIAGEEINEAIFAIRELNALGAAASFDHLGESISSEAEAEAEVREYLRVLGRIESSGIRANVSVKPTQLGLDINERLCLRNARLIVEEAARLQNFVRIDMEDSTKTAGTLRVFRSLRERYENVGIAIQAYLYRSERDIEEMLALGAKIRLCKGAYAEPASVAFPQKRDVDANYVKLMRRLLRSGIYHGIATHDEKIIAEAKDFVAREGVARDAFEFQMLYGIRRDLQVKLIEEGYRVRTYVPYGAYWYPYFMRRLAERPANIWFVLKNLLRGD
ncbi:MAG: proline dehydrogenase family protein [Blastocatellia bacterium]